MSSTKAVFEDLRRGVQYAKRGAAHVRQHPDLLLWGVVPSMLHTSAVMIAFRLAFWEVAGFVERLLLGASGGEAPAVVRELQLSVFSLLSTMVSVAAFAVFVVFGLLFSMLLSAPALQAMSQEVEETLDEEEGKETADGGWEWQAPMARSLLGILSWAGGQTLMLPLQLLPVFGGMLEAGLGVGWSSLLIARELMDGALARRGHTFSQQLRLMWKHRVPAGALGGVGGLTLWIPVLNIAAFPALVASATMMVRDFPEEEDPTEPEHPPPDDS